VPAEQLEQVVDDAKAENFPTKHVEQTVADAAEYAPAAQLSVTADRPIVAQYDPAVQALHALNPVDAANEPLLQLEQLEDPAADEKVPAMQDEQTVAEDAE